MKCNVTVELPDVGDCKLCQFFDSSWGLCHLFKQAVINCRSLEVCNKLRSFKKDDISVGDTVECINDKGCEGLRNGLKYEVVHVDPPYLSVQRGSVRGSWSQFRFKKVPATGDDTCGKE